MATAIVHLASSEFLTTGHEVDAQHVLVTVPRNPDAAREKYSGDPLNPIAVKSAPEIAATQTAQQDAAAAEAFDTAKAIKAVALSNLAARLGKAPGALTNAEINAERTRILAIYKTL